MSIRDLIQLLHSSEDRVEGTLWNRLFTKVSARLKRETNIRLKNFITVRVPNHSPSFRQNVYALSKVQEGRRSRRPISWFAISKHAKAEDRRGSAASALFVNIPLHLVLDYIDYEPSRNGLFRVGAWVLNQVQGLPMGGPDSAQLACIYMAVRETKNTAVALFTPNILACHYRDNIYVFGRKSLLLQRLPEFQHTLASY